MKRYAQYPTLSSPEDVDLWVARCYTEEELDELSAAYSQDSPLANYKGGLSHHMNAIARVHGEAEGVADLQKLLLSKTIREPIAVYRFVCFGELLRLWWYTQRNKLYEYPHFLSTTLLKNHYSMENIKRNRLPIMIGIPQGIPGTFLPEVNPEQPEFEILLPHHLQVSRISWNKYVIVNEDVTP